MKNRKSQSGFIRAVKKLFLSAFVVVSFAAYALENRGVPAALQPGDVPTAGNFPEQSTASPTSSNNAVVQAPPARPAPTDTPSQATINNPLPANTAPPTQAPTSTVPPTSTPAPTATAAQNGQYKDGTYTGPTVNVFYGDVQVQVVVQNGQVADVQFLQYPQDRRTSRYINSFAVPALKQEAVQAQSANVNLISGATLTSEGFYRSLQMALSKAQ